MKKMIWEFIRRGIAALGFGPLVLAACYLILWKQDAVQILTIQEVCLGIFSLSALAFIAGGMNFIYQIERLPLMVAILIHGSILYASYLITYLINGWLEQDRTPILVFTGIFVLGYLAIWAVIYAITKKRTASINAVLKQKQENPK